MNGPESNNLPGLRSGHRICTYVYREFENEKRKLAWYDGEFCKNQRSKFFISIGCGFGRIMQMNDLFNDKFNTQNDSGCG